MTTPGLLSPFRSLLSARLYLDLGRSRGTCCR
ncbi:hypothetical protein SAMN05216499_11568 [Actinacidiphila paucisporea]|uniref:Uncharacterized protein n=1 Tax=Actinacidiphila paucisporea TaxID=310782 RepID=A0A1M7M3T4_9ACTN|nr:hypothetical protein SAMN05216499_11568 [Actinacidiphila paucisporea]